MGRFFALSMGGVLVAAGVVVAPLPGPFGLPLTLGGLILLLRHSRWVRKTYVRSSQRWPKIGALFNRLLRRSKS